jgi:hypothetical protein
MSGARRLELAPPVERKAALRCLDYPHGREPPARIAGLLDAILVEARSLLEARGAWLPFAAERCGALGLRTLEAEGLALGLVTIGPALEERVAALQGEGRLTEALLLDACGSAAAEEAADLLSASLLGALGHAPEGGAAAGSPGCRVSPGYGDWDLEHQPALLELLGAAALGVSLSPGLMMTPRKSISFAMWLGARERPAEGLAGCRACGLRRCRYLSHPRSSP